MIKLTMIKEILQIGDPILVTKTNPVKDTQSTEVKKVIRDLLDTCHKNADISAGLAAPQIGYNMSICVCRRVDLEAKDEQLDEEKLWTVLINPHVVKESHKNTLEWEACLSIGRGDDNLWGPVERPKKVTVNYVDIDGMPQTIEAIDYFGHIVQHEIDHLAGVLFISYITNPSNLWRLVDLNNYIDKNDSYPDIE